MGGFTGNSSGGGFFFSPFSSTQVFAPYTPAPGLAPFTNGAWNHLAAPIATRRARWLTMVVSPQALPPISYYYVQLGLGLIGGPENLWQPSDGNAFIIDWLSPIGAGFNVPFVMSFPITTPPGQEISVRCASSVAPVAGLNITLYVFN